MKEFRAKTTSIFVEDPDRKINAAYAVVACVVCGEIMKANCTVSTDVAIAPDPEIFILMSQEHQLNDVEDLKRALEKHYTNNHLLNQSKFEVTE